MGPNTGVSPAEGMGLGMAKAAVQPIQVSLVCLAIMWAFWHGPLSPAPLPHQHASRGWPSSSQSKATYRCEEQAKRSGSR